MPDLCADACVQLKRVLDRFAAVFSQSGDADASVFCRMRAVHCAALAHGLNSAEHREAVRALSRDCASLVWADGHRVAPGLEGIIAKHGF